MLKQAQERYREVLQCWGSEEFRGHDSYEWAKDRTSAHMHERCEEVVNDAMDYLHLLLKWPIFVRAIDRLSFANDWLYDPVDEISLTTISTTHGGRQASHGMPLHSVQ